MGPHALGLAPACPGASATDQRLCHPREAQCRALAWGCVIYASPVWGGMGTGGLFLSLVPTEDHSFGLVLVKSKLLPPTPPYPLPTSPGCCEN